MEMNRHCCAALHYAMLSDTVKNQIEIGACVYNQQRNRNAVRSTHDPGLSDLLAIIAERSGFARRKRFYCFQWEGV